MEGSPFSVYHSAGSVKAMHLVKPYTSSTQYTALIPSSLGLMNELQDFYII